MNRLTCRDLSALGVDGLDAFLDHDPQSQRDEPLCLCHSAPLEMPESCRDLTRLSSLGFADNLHLIVCCRCFEAWQVLCACDADQAGELLLMTARRVLREAALPALREAA